MNIYKEMVKGMTPEEIDAYVLGLTAGGFSVEWLAAILFLQHGVDLYTLYQPELDTAASMEIDKMNQNYFRGWEECNNGLKNACGNLTLGKFTNYRRQFRDRENKENETKK
jgi:hypothetical protein